MEGGGGEGGKWREGEREREGNGGRGGWRGKGEGREEEEREGGGEQSSAKSAVVDVPFNYEILRRMLLYLTLHRFVAWSRRCIAMRVHRRD